jgi:hypothetical protein
MGYEVKERDNYSQSTTVQGQARRARVATGVRSKFLRNLLLSSKLGSSQDNDHFGLTEQLAH